MPKGDFSKTEEFKAIIREKTRIREAAKTHCVNGHPRTEDSSYVYGAKKHCKECTKIRGQKYKNTGKRQKRRREYYYTTKGKEASRRESLNSRYGKGAADYYKQKQVEQENLCAICKQPPKPGKVLALDHRHSDEKWRSLLCDACNQGIGFFKENKKNLATAIDYLWFWETRLGEEPDGKTKA